MVKREAGQLYPVIKHLLGPIVNRLWDIEVVGLENLPASGPAILTPNHLAFMDSVFVPAVLPRQITYVGKADYMDDWKTKHLLPACGMIPIDRSGGESGELALQAAQRVLDRNELFGIYPEGTRSRSGMLHKGHTGPARLALRTGAPIVPVGLVGTAEIQPPDSAMPKFFRSVSVRFGQPISVERYRAKQDDRRVLRQIIDEVMFEISKLSGQEYVDTYAGKETPAPAEPTIVTTPVGSTAPAANVEPTRRAASVLVGAPLADDENLVPRRSSTEVLQPVPLPVS